MKKTRLKLTSFALLLALLLSSLVSVTTAADEYNYTYRDATPLIETEDSFKRTFGNSNVNEIMYDYYLSDTEIYDTYVMLAFTIRVGNKDYFAIAEGGIKSYTLPSGRILIEGPITGYTSINDITYRLSIGFAKIEGSDETMISVTMTGVDGDLIAFSFGQNILEGEVLDFILDKVQRSTSSDSFNIEIENDILASNGNPTDTCGIGDIIIPPLPYDPPTGGVDPDLNLGANGEYEYQSARFARWYNTSYNAFESNVYWSESTNEMLVTFNPDNEETQDYVNSSSSIWEAASLKYFSISLELNANSPAANRGKIDGIYVPGLNSTAGTGSQLTEDLLLALFYDFLSLLGIPTSTIEYALDRINGDIYVCNNSYDAIIEITLAEGSVISDDLTHGLPFRFILEKLNDTTYEGHTEYTVTFFAKYRVVNKTGTSTYTYQYHEVTTTHLGYVDIQ